MLVTIYKERVNAAREGFVNSVITPKEYREAVQEFDDTFFLHKMRKPCSK